MAAGINKQPLFTGTPVLTCLIFDPPIINSACDPASFSPQPVYQGSSNYGDLIDRVTISSTGDINNNIVTDKLIYVYLYDNVYSNYSLYKTIVMPYTEISTTVSNVELELVFTGGLLLKPNDAIYIGASDNFNNTGRKGDQLSITIEGGTYTQQA